MSIYPGAKDILTSTQLDRLYVMEEGSERYLDIQLKPDGDIAITTEGNDCCLSFDEFREKFFPKSERYVNKQGYFEGGVKFVEDRGGDNVVSVFNAGGEVHFGRENLDDCIARGAYVEGDVRRFQYAKGPLFKCGTMYVEVCSNGKAYCVRPDGTRNPFLGAGRMTPREFAEQAVRKGAWVEL